MGDKSESKQRLQGAVLSYINTAANMLITLLLTPLLLYGCGESDYSVYKVMSSFASPLSVVNFGISVYVSRAIAQSNQIGEDNTSLSRQRVLGMSLVISGVLFTIALAISTGFYSLIGVIYEKSFTAEEMELAKTLFVIIALNISLNIIDNGFQGCLIGNEQFTSFYGILLIRTVLKGITLFSIIKLGGSIIMVALADLSLTVLAMILKVMSVKLKLHEKFCFTCFDKREFKIFLTFSIAMILQTVINNVNQSMDNVILGAMISDKSVITMYSSALTICTVFVSLSYVISGVYHPRIIKAVAANDSLEVLTQKAIQPSKYQAIITSLFGIGFILFGKSFITMWIGDRYADAYYICVCIIIPSCLVAVSGIYEAFLDAKLKRMVRSMILFGMAVYNAVVSIILTRLIGYWGAAIGTATSYVFGNLILMNLYASKVSGISAAKLYSGAFAGIWKSIVLSLLIGITIELLLPKSLVWFIVKVVTFLTVYVATTWTIGLNKNEKTQLRSMLKRQERT